MEGREQQGIEVERLHQEPEKICHYTVVTENHRGLTGKLDGKEERGTTSEKNSTRHTSDMGTKKSAQRRFECSQDLCDYFTVERVQWFVSSLENRDASFMNTATAFRMNVMKSWM